MEIKILDCTLRDGGYTNNWDFDKKDITNIVESLQSSYIDYIELGFIKKSNQDTTGTIFSSFEKIDNLIDTLPMNNNYSAMIAVDKFPMEEIPPCIDSNIKNIRLIFKPHQISKAIRYSANIKSKGYNLFINPTFITSYAASQIKNLILEINEFNPVAFSIIDSLGAMQQSELLYFYNIANEFLKENIFIGYHAHDNLKTAFLNAKALISNIKNRTLLLDSTIYGIGRGAGNLNTEFIIEYLNNNYCYSYKNEPIIKLINKNKKFFKKPKNTTPYYIAAKNHIHPNYPRFLIQKNIPDELIEDILKKIPNNKKISFDLNLIKRLI